MKTIPTLSILEVLYKNNGILYENNYTNNILMRLDNFLPKLAKPKRKGAWDAP